MFTEESILASKRAEFAQAFSSDFFGLKLQVIRHYVVNVPGDRRATPRPAPEDHYSPEEP